MVGLTDEHIFVGILPACTINLKFSAYSYRIESSFRQTKHIPKDHWLRLKEEVQSKIIIISKERVKISLQIGAKIMQIG